MKMEFSGSVCGRCWRSDVCSLYGYGMTFDWVGFCVGHCVICRQKFFTDTCIDSLTFQSNLGCD